jgi:hypothetical protein
MQNFRKWFLTSAIASSVMIAGCGGSSSSSTSPDDAASSMQVSGIASAPGGGTVAQFESESVFELALQFFVPSAAAAFTGLEPVKGADVELIRVDNDGNQVGDVLATSRTSSSGNYSLDIPAGTSLAGNLIVRITGANDNQLRAQVVEQEVDIDPISEYVLQKFIDRGADLENLETNRVATLKGQADEFDLTAGANLSDTLAILDREVGDFVDGQVDAISTPDGDVTEIAGDFRSSAVEFALGDIDGGGAGDFSIELYGDDFVFTDNGGGEVAIEASGVPSAFAILSGADAGAPSVFYSAELADTETESFIAPYTSNGVLTISAGFEERIESESGTRFPPAVFRLQSTIDKDLLFLLGQEAVVDYELADTNGDGQGDAVDPDQKIGDDVRRSLQIFARLPQNASDADLTGSFGLVSLRTRLIEGAGIEMESEVSDVTFDGQGNLSVIAGGSRLDLARNANGEQTSSASEETGETISVTLDADGTISKLNDAAADGFVNSNFDFVVIPSDTGVSSDGGNDFGQLNQTLLIKRPNDTAPELTNRTYRVFLLSATFENDKDIYIYYTGFDSTLEFSSETAANLVADYSYVGKEGSAGLASQVVVDDFPLDKTLHVSLDGTGALAMTAPQQNGGPGVTTMEGFVNADGSLGLLRTSYDPDGDGQGINDLGLMVLVEIPQ